MIKSVLPKIISQQQDEKSITWRLFIDGSLPFFAGHFPEQAVLPGVSQLDWAVQLGCQAFGYNPSVKNVEVLKFQQLILPNTYVNLTISNNVDKAKITFQFAEEDRRFASGRIAFNAPALSD
ncbi:ApeI family dehydratase [Shewanella gaetbuli]|uniref:Thioester dehydrase n=1 Tax=Shewanella gaetbuli TaxID=220752 RepID=A0A9X1ZJJ8_9GAMM|nr:thioester dehydrase [Shewanella gaetbuli]MCL1143519.1 thioester dehydrase [Shewanella gaetbuli]